MIMSHAMHLFIRGEIGFTGRYQWSDGSFHSEAEKIEPSLTDDDVCTCCGLEVCMNPYYDDDDYEEYYGVD